MLFSEMASASFASPASPMLQSLRLSAVTLVLWSSASASDAVSTADFPLKTTLDMSSSVCVRLSLSATNWIVLSTIASFAYCMDAIARADESDADDRGRARRAEGVSWRRCEGSTTCLIEAL